MKKITKKGQSLNINTILPVALVFVVVGIAIAFGLNILGDVRDDFCTYGSNGAVCKNSTGGTGGVSESTEFNATVNAVSAVAKFPAKLGILATVLIAAILIGVLVRYMGGMGAGR